METTETKLIDLQRQTEDAIRNANDVRIAELAQRKYENELRQQELALMQARIESDIERAKADTLAAHVAAAERETAEHIRAETQRKNDLMDSYLNQTELALQTIETMLQIVNTNTQEVRQLLQAHTLTLQRWDRLESVMQERLTHIYQCLLLFVSKLPDQKGLEIEIDRLRRAAQPIVNVGANMMTNGNLSAGNDVTLRG
jgi:hypothetical protein